MRLWLMYFKARINMKTREQNLFQCVVCAIFMGGLLAVIWNQICTIDETLKTLENAIVALFLVLASISFLFYPITTFLHRKEIDLKKNKGTVLLWLVGDVLILSILMLIITWIK